MTGVLDVVRTAPRDTARTVGDFSSGGPVPVVRQSVRTRDGRTVAYADMGGRGRDVLLIHGTLMTLEDMWLGPADTLANHGYRVVAVDRPGHGDSARVRLVDVSPWRQAEILHDAMMALGLHRPTIIGHSAGGAVLAGRSTDRCSRGPANGRKPRGASKRGRNTAASLPMGVVAEPSSVCHFALKHAGAVRGRVGRRNVRCRAIERGKRGP